MKRRLVMLREHLYKNKKRYLILIAILVLFALFVIPLGIKTGTIPITKGFRKSLARIFPEYLLPSEEKETTSTVAGGQTGPKDKNKQGDQESAQTETGTTGTAVSPYAPPTSALPNEFIVFVSGRGGDREIYGMNSAGQNLNDLSQNPTPEFQPKLSPSKTAIMYVRGDVFDSEIVIMNVDGSNKHQITVDQPADIFSEWAPNGSKIAYVAQKDYKAALYVMDTDGGHQTKLADGGVITSFDWSPESNSIVYAQTELDNKSRSIYLVNVDGKGKVKLTGEVNAFDDHPDWFPTGDKIAFLSSSEQTSKQRYLYLVNKDGTGRKILRGSPTQQFVISSDGRKIAFAAGNTQSSSIGVINADGSSEIALTDILPGQAQIPVQWSSNNSSLLVVVYPKGMSSKISDIYILDTLNKNLKRLTTGGYNHQPDW